MKTLILSISLLLAVMHFTYCQKLFRSKGTAKVKIDPQISKTEARAKARELAIINAIEEKFGSYVEQETNIDIENGQTKFKVIGNTRVKGEWVKTLREDYTEDLRSIEGEYGKEYELWIECEIEGKVREVQQVKVEFEAIPLNCPNKICRTTEFQQEEPFYLYFRSPVNGHLSVFMVEEDEAYRLLPYQQMAENYTDAVPIKEDQPYIFFSTEEEHQYYKEFNQQIVDELVLTTEKEIEYVQLYLIFSSNEFQKPLLDPMIYSREEFHTPKSLSKGNFQKWLREIRTLDISFNYQIINLKIRK
ncbi:hypothetical protein [Xanthovirga aplysinae]|uniref:hypothetical protein n=1 Tax=Xanthovirga aplysinae TaxID=2529853 RepID=UPI0012BC11AC|nr:hypothetical protein [Xanthovirga aplysinae]MTI32961.1 hypothetical protein [Xanthovirga aplysinae]